ncbi:MAG: SpoIIIAC/SpoIIIAD family protein [Turicibacter sp.]
MMIDVIEIYRIAGVGVIFGLAGLFLKKLKVSDDFSNLIQIVGYIYLLIVIAQLISVLMESLKSTFML